MTQLLVLSSVYRKPVVRYLVLFVPALLAFVLSRKEFMFRTPITLLFIFTMYFNAGLIPSYLWLSRLGFANTFWVYVIPGMISAFNLLVIRTYIRGLPESLVESAQIDGAGYFTIFMKVSSDGIFSPRSTIPI